MIDFIIEFSVRNKLIVFLFVLSLVVWGIYSLIQIPIGAVPDITNNQGQVITTSRNLSTEDIEQFITYPIELEMERSYSREQKIIARNVYRSQDFVRRKISACYSS